MKKHMKRHAAKNSYQCAMCGKCFISWNNIQMHMKSHAWNNPYICALFGEEFISRNHIRRRIKIHTVENPQHCHPCGKVLIPWNHLKSNGNKPKYYCVLCNSGFKFSLHMKKHMMCHPVENSYQCVLSGKCFISWNNIQRHIKSPAWGQSISLCS